MDWAIQMPGWSGPREPTAKGHRKEIVEGTHVDGPGRKDLMQKDTTIRWSEDILSGC